VRGPQLGLGGQLKATCILVSSLNILRSSTFDVSGHYFEHTIGVRDKRDDMSGLTHHYRVFPVIIPASSRYPLLHTHCRSVYKLRDLSLFTYKNSPCQPEQKSKDKSKLFYLFYTLTMLPKLLYFSIIVTFIVGIGYCDTTWDIHSPSHLIPREEPVSAIASITSITLDVQSCSTNRRSRISRQSQSGHCYQEDGNYHSSAGDPQDSITLEIDDQEASITGLADYQPPGSITWYPNFRFRNLSPISVFMTVYNLRSHVNYPTVTMAPGYTHDFYLTEDGQPNLAPDWRNDDPILFKIWWYDS
jgi:hypothetical protein